MAELRPNLPEFGPAVRYIRAAARTLAAVLAVDPLFIVGRDQTVRQLLHLDLIPQEIELFGDQHR